MREFYDLPSVEPEEFQPPVCFATGEREPDYRLVSDREWGWREQRQSRRDPATARNPPNWNAVTSSTVLVDDQHVSDFFRGWRESVDELA